MNTLQGSKVDRDSTRNQDMKRRRTVNAAASQDPHDYIIQDELTTVKVQIDEVLTNLKDQVSQIKSWPGEKFGTLSPDEKPTNLRKVDKGFLFHSTDFKHSFRWTGSAWEWAPTDSIRPGFFIFTDADPGAGWQLCDGSTVTRCKLIGDGTTESVTVPNATDCYIKHGTYSSSPISAVAPTINAASAGTPTGSIGAASGTDEVQSGTGATPAGSGHTHTFTGDALPTHTHTAQTNAEPKHLVASLYMRL